MAIRCPNCKREYDVTLFEFGRSVRCACGKVITLQHEEMFKGLLGAYWDEEKKILEIKDLADKISFLIVSTDYPKIDIEIEKRKFKEKIEELFPEKSYLYELIYEPRFRRLEEQFRSGE